MQIARRVFSYAGKTIRVLQCQRFKGVEGPISFGDRMRKPTFVERVERGGLTPIKAGLCGLFLSTIAGGQAYFWYCDGRLYARVGWITYHDHPHEFVYAAITIVLLGLIGVGMLATTVGLVCKRRRYPLGIFLDDE